MKSVCLGRKATNSQRKSMIANSEAKDWASKSQFRLGKQHTGFSPFLETTPRPIISPSTVRPLISPGWEKQLDGTNAF
jgi:hypothetical protein